MNKHIIRFVACLLASCLAADPAAASAISQIPNLPVRQSSIDQPIFQAQAFALVAAFSRRAYNDIDHIARSLLAGVPKKAAGGSGAIAAWLRQRRQALFVGLRYDASYPAKDYLKSLRPWRQPMKDSVAGASGYTDDRLTAEQSMDQRIKVLTDFYREALALVVTHAHITHYELEGLAELHLQSAARFLAEFHEREKKSVGEVDSRGRSDGKLLLDALNGTVSRSYLLELREGALAGMNRDLAQLNGRVVRIYSANLRMPYLFLEKPEAPVQAPAPPPQVQTVTPRAAEIRSSLIQRLPWRWKWVALPSLFWLDGSFHILTAYGTGFVRKLAWREVWAQRGGLYAGRVDLSTAPLVHQITTFVSVIILSPLLIIMLFGLAWYTGDGFERSVGDALLYLTGGFTLLRVVVDWVFLESPLQQLSYVQALRREFTSPSNPSGQIPRPLPSANPPPSDAWVEIQNARAVDKLLEPFKKARDQFLKDPNAKRYREIIKKSRDLAPHVDTAYEIGEIRKIRRKAARTFKARLILTGSREKERKPGDPAGSAGRLELKRAIPDQYEDDAFKKHGWKGAPLEIRPIEAIYPADPNRKWVKHLQATILKISETLREALLEKNAVTFKQTIAELNDYLWAYQIASQVVKADTKATQAAIQKCQQLTEEFMRASPDAHIAMNSLRSQLKSAVDHDQRSSGRSTKFALLAKGEKGHLLRVDELLRRWDSLDASVLAWRSTPSGAAFKESQAGGLSRDLETFYSDLQKELTALESAVPEKDRGRSLSLLGSKLTWGDFEWSVRHLRLWVAPGPVFVHDDDFANSLKQHAALAALGMIRVRVEAPAGPERIRGTFDEASTTRAVVYLLKMARIAKAKNIAIHLESEHEDRVRMTVTFDGAGLSQTELTKDLNPADKKSKETNGRNAAAKRPKGGSEMAMIQGAILKRMGGSVKPQISKDPRNGEEMMTGMIIILPFRPGAQVPEAPASEPLSQIPAAVERAQPEAPPARAAETRPIPEGPLMSRFESAVENFVKDPAAGTDTVTGLFPELVSLLSGKAYTSDELARARTKSEGAIDQRVTAVVHAVSDAVLEAVAIRNPVTEMALLNEDAEFYVEEADDAWVVALGNRILRISFWIRHLRISDENTLLDVLADLMDTMEAYQAGSQRLPGERTSKATEAASGMESILLVQDGYDPLNRPVDRWLENLIGGTARSEMRYHVVPVKDVNEAHGRIQQGRFAAVVLRPPVSANPADLIRLIKKPVEEQNLDAATIKATGMAKVAAELKTLWPLPGDREQDVLFPAETPEEEKNLEPEKIKPIRMAKYAAELETLWGLPVAWTGPTPTATAQTLFTITRGRRSSETRAVVHLPWREKAERVAQDWQDKHWIASARHFLAPLLRAGEKVDEALDRSGSTPSEERAWKRARALLDLFSELLEQAFVSPEGSLQFRGQRSQEGDARFDVNFQSLLGPIDAELRFHKGGGADQLAFIFTQAESSSWNSEPMGFIGEIRLEAGPAEDSFPNLTATTTRPLQRPDRQAPVKRQPPKNPYYDAFINGEPLHLAWATSEDPKDSRAGFAEFVARFLQRMTQHPSAPEPPASPSSPNSTNGAAIVVLALAAAIGSFNGIAAAGLAPAMQRLVEPQQKRPIQRLLGRAA